MQTPRKEAGRELVLNAATNPLALSLGAGISVIAAVLGMHFLFLFAVIAYIAVAGSVLFDDEEAKKLAAKRKEVREQELRLDDLPHQVASRITRARESRDQIVETLAAGPDPMVAVQVELGSLVQEIETLAKTVAPAVSFIARQSRLNNVASTADPYKRLDSKINSIYSTLDNAILEIERLGAEAVANALEPHSMAQEDLTARVTVLREELSSVGVGLQSAYGAAA